MKWLYTGCHQAKSRWLPKSDQHLSYNWFSLWRCLWYLCLVRVNIWLVTRTFQYCTVISNLILVVTKLCNRKGKQRNGKWKFKFSLIALDSSLVCFVVCLCHCYHWEQSWCTVRVRSRQDRKSAVLAQWNFAHLFLLMLRTNFNLKFREKRNTFLLIEWQNLVYYVKFIKYFSFKLKGKKVCWFNYEKPLHPPINFF